MDTELLGRRVLGTVEPAIARWIERYVPRNSSVEPSPFTIEVVADGAIVPDSIRERESRDSLLGTRHIAVGDDEFWILESVDGVEHGVQGRFIAGGARLACVGESFTAWEALRQALCEALAASGVVWIHAAVAQVGEATLALLGPSGRGKSTTLLRAVDAGWKPLAEDAAFVDVATLTIVGADDRDSVRLRPGFAATGVPLPATMPTVASDGRFEIPFQDLGGRVPTARLTHLVRLVRGPSPSAAWSELSRAEAVMALHEAAGVPTTRHVGRIVGPTFGDLVARVHTLTLDLGDPQAPIPAPPHT